MSEAALTSRNFTENARKALADAKLQRVLAGMGVFQLARHIAVSRLPEFDALRDEGKAIKDHTLAHLDAYLDIFEEKVRASGGHVHWAASAEEACELVASLCRDADARKILKGKSMVTEEIGLNAHLEGQGFDVLETDLGEYIIQLRHERPSHILAPAMHLSPDQVAQSFRQAHGTLDPARDLSLAESLVSEARQVLRDHFFSADVGITGANFLVAETGSAVVVTNEGNGDLSMTLSRCHIVVTSIDKIVPTLNDVATLLRLLSRSVTGQELASYTTYVTGPKQTGDLDGPSEFHVVLVDNGRSAILGGEYRDVLRCIRCSACMNHCPVFGSVGGHAYGSIYPGPIGAVMTPALWGLAEAQELPHATTVCGRCDEVCPVRIPLTKLMRSWREREFRRHMIPPKASLALSVWAHAARRPGLYACVTRLAAWMLAILGGRTRRLRWLPFMGSWTQTRDFPAPEGRTFRDLWRQRGGAS